MDGKTTYYNLKSKFASCVSSKRIALEHSLLLQEDPRLLKFADRDVPFEPEIFTYLAYTFFPYICVEPDSNITKSFCEMNQCICSKVRIEDLDVHVVGHDHYEITRACEDKRIYLFVRPRKCDGRVRGHRSPRSLSPVKRRK